MPIALAAVTALTWGVNELLVLRATRRADWFPVALWLSVLGGAVTLPLALAFEPVPAPGDVPLALAPGFVGMLALFLYLTALRVGKLAVVSPTVACSGGIAAVLAIVLLDETFETGVFLAVGASVVGVILASLQRRSGLTGQGWAVAAAVLFGFYTFALSISTQEVGPLWSVFAYRAATLITLIPLALIQRRSLALPRDVRSLVVLCSLLETIGFIALTYALDLGPVAVVSVVMAQFSTVAVVLAWGVLHERLQAHQWAGVAIVLVSITALGVLQ